MKYFLNLLFIVIFVQVSAVSATTYLKFWVNQDTSHTLTQGDFFAWEFDVTNPGNTADVELWLDLDKSRDISESDILLEIFTQTDGEISMDDGPADSSGTPDGIVYVMLGQFGFAPQSYFMRITDQDNSSAQNWFEISEMSNPPATASGRVFVEGVDAPNEMLANIMVGAMGETGICSGLTDDDGNYTINLTVAGAEWEISPFFEGQLPGYINQEDYYRQTLPAGNTDSLNFHYLSPKAYVYGDILDQDGLLIDINGYIGLENRTSYTQSNSVAVNGHYVIPANVLVQGTDSTNYFTLQIDQTAIFPEYMGPAYQEEFPVSYGDSIRRDLHLYQTDALIYGYVRENAALPSQSYKFYAHSDSTGYMEVESDATTGYFEIPVRSGAVYGVSLNDDPNWGTPALPGLVLEHNNQPAQPGDTVWFDFIPAEAMIGGTISFDEGDPDDFDYDHHTIFAWDSTYSTGYLSRVTEDNTFNVGVPNGRYHVSLDPEYINNYLVWPSEINNVVVQGDTVDTLHFLLNYGHADLIVKFVNVPIPVKQFGYRIQTQGEWPNVYSAWQNTMYADSTFRFKICEGEWYISLPPELEAYRNDIILTDTVLTVTEQDSSYYVEFKIEVPMAVVTQEVSPPAQFYLGQNYPNPFNPATTIAFGLAQAGHVKISVYNILGEMIEVLVDEWKNTGNYQVQWRPQIIASGVYLYRIETPNRIETKKMIFTK